MEASHLSKMLPFYVSVNHASVCNSTCVRVSYQHFNITCRILYVLTYIRGGHGLFCNIQSSKRMQTDMGKKDNKINTGKHNGFI